MRDREHSWHTQNIHIHIYENTLFHGWYFDVDRHVIRSFSHFNLGYICVFVALVMAAAAVVVVVVVRVVGSSIRTSYLRFTVEMNTQFYAKKKKKETGFILL